MSDIITNTVEAPAEITGPLSPEQVAEAAPETPAEPSQAQPEQPAPEGTPDDSEEQPEPSLGDVAESVQEQRSEVQKILESANIKLDGLEDEYLANGGKLSDESYDSLEKAGFSRKVVDTYIAGVETANAKITVMQEREIEGIKAVAGGSEAYASLTEWARAALSPDEIAGFNAITATNDPTAIRMAVKGLLAQYHAAEGKDPQYITGSGPGTLPQDVYNSWAQVTADMADPRYREDEAFRKTVADKISRSGL